MTYACILNNDCILLNSTTFDSLTITVKFLLKGRFSSWLEGASAIKLFGDLIGKQPCELMHDNQTKW